jgi:hypothetical protein
VPIFVRAAGPPQNDDFAQRLKLTGTILHMTKPAGQATLEPEEPRPQPGYGGQTLWWSWTAYDHSPVTVSAQNSSSTETSVAVYRGQSIDKLFLVSQGIPQTRFVPEAGITYAIVVEQKNRAEFVTLDIAVADTRIERISPTLPRAGEPVALTLAQSTRSITNVQLLAAEQLIAMTNRAPTNLNYRFATNGFFDLVTVSRDARGIETVSAPFRISVRPANDSLIVMRLGSRAFPRTLISLRKRQQGKRSTRSGLRGFGIPSGTCGKLRPMGFAG